MLVDLKAWPLLSTDVPDGGCLGHCVKASGHPSASKCAGSSEESPHIISPLPFKRAWKRIWFGPRPLMYLKRFSVFIARFGHLSSSLLCTVACFGSEDPHR